MSRYQLKPSAGPRSAEEAEPVGGCVVGESRGAGSLHSRFESGFGSSSRDDPRLIHDLVRAGMAGIWHGPRF